MATQMESPLLDPLSGVDRESQSSNMASPVQFIKEYIERTLNTPPGFPVSVAAEHYKRQRLVEEIVESETEYVQMLKILRNCFLDVLSINDYIPMKVLNNVVGQILAHHEELCRCLQAVVDGSVKRFDETTELNWSDLSLTSWDHLEVCQQVAEILSTHAVQAKQYCSYLYYYNQISHLLARMGRESEDGLLFAILFRIELCLPKYYSHTSHQGYKRDFSFRAMIQMPINRIAKYRLFLESLVYLTETPSITDLRRLDETKCQALIHSIKTSLGSMYSNLQKVDEANCEKLPDPALVLVYNRLTFSSPDERIPVEAMGNCYTRGCLAVAWTCMDEAAHSAGSHRKSSARYFNNFHRAKRSLRIESEQLGVFLFKSYLIFAEIPSFKLGTASYEWPIKFAIRLASCRLMDARPAVQRALQGGMKDCGIYSEYENAIKLQFEYDFKLWEILLLCWDSQELEAWRKELSLFINEINGPHTFGVDPLRETVSQSALESTLHFSDSTTFPDQMLPFMVYNENLSGRFDRTRAFKRGLSTRAGQCYEGQTVEVAVEFRNADVDMSPSSTWFLRGSSSRVNCTTLASSSTCAFVEASTGVSSTPDAEAISINERCREQRDSSAPCAVLSRWRRGEIERAMRDVWSSHLNLQAADIITTVAGASTGTSIYDDTLGSLRALLRTASDNCVAVTGTQSTPVKSSCAQPPAPPARAATRWSIKRVFSRRRRGSQSVVRHQNALKR
ncbi:KLTH0E03432p [Lachancea thermotolerans CBS 6340]|uniref:KLTH0E03432p n=1 Tax=Lachancea thermotolerans (strain ATCC 56472 / CBS 6340 / NRRL Y-8284) TaxID=559295 RepID=C5DHD3_LACTC|nr:KLTH0E03432p [Lachancea thermotolerans CBS 6340]CAR23194.1 KLTH0E03432p [Lachancea thermotolerans CBS 6340]